LARVFLSPSEGGERKRKGKKRTVGRKLLDPANFRKSEQAITQRIIHLREEGGEEKVGDRPFLRTKMEKKKKGERSGENIVADAGNTTPKKRKGEKKKRARFILADAEGGGKEEKNP